MGLLILTNHWHLQVESLGNLWNNTPLHSFLSLLLVQPGMEQFFGITRIQIQRKTTSLQFNAQLHCQLNVHQTTQNTQISILWARLTTLVCNDVMVEKVYWEPSYSKDTLFFIDCFHWCGHIAVLAAISLINILHTTLQVSTHKSMNKGMQDSNEWRDR